uniref:uncharacterized protein LOC122587524 n=1 Tax=Erigeron canadensis TaxID=72917 RepID=UPI001CB97381
HPRHSFQTPGETNAAIDGGPVTHLITLHNAAHDDTIKAEHLNGLVFFTSRITKFRVCCKPGYSVKALIYPCKLIESLWLHNSGKSHHRLMCISHIISYIRLIVVLEVARSVGWTTTAGILIFSITSYSWRKIDVKLPFDISEGH